MATGFAWHERFMWHDNGNAIGLMPTQGLYPPGQHFENPETKRRLKNLLDGYGITDRLTLLTPTPASTEELAAVHTEGHIQRVAALSRGSGGDAGEFALVAPGSDEIARLAAGGTMAAVDAVVRGAVDNAYALSRPPGHHAEPDRGMGFCIYNNIAVAVQAARKAHGLRRVAVVDWDVHHGNGNETFYLSDADTLTISLHQDGLYPFGRGGIDVVGEGAARGCNINIPLPAGSGAGAYEAAFERIVEPAMERFAPELIVVACGFDACAMDPLGRMLLSSNHFRMLTRRIRRVAEALCGGRLAMSHEGGYSDAYVPFCGLAVIETLADLDSDCVDPLSMLMEVPPGQDLQPHQEAAIEAARRAAPLLAQASA